MLIWLAMMVLIVFLDQLTKYLTVLYLKPIDTLPIIKDVIHLTYVENTGAAFGMMKNQRWLFMIVSTVAIAAMLIYLFKKKTQPKLENVAIAFIVGGGIGNMIDRVLLGYVVDMIDFRLINFAVFNVADSFVCVGAGLLMLYIIKLGIEEYKEEKAKKLALAEGDVSEDYDTDVIDENESFVDGTSVDDMSDDEPTEGGETDDEPTEGGETADESVEDDDHA